MVELIINGINSDISDVTNIKFTKQISDIFDLANVSCSYSNSFELEKTPNNTQIMGQLGISSDRSLIPYQKNTAILKYDGFDIVSNGWLNVLSTEETYKVSVADGMIDFFKAIENKTIGLDLDLINFDHQKNLLTVIESFTNEYYKYIIADYGGKVFFDDGINIDYLAPSFSVKKIWDLIFKTFNFNCDYTNLDYIDNLYLTYPKEVSQEINYDLIATFYKEPYESFASTLSGNYVFNSFNYSWDSYDYPGGNGDWNFVITEKGSYNFNLEIEMYVQYQRNGRYDRSVDNFVNIYKNGIEIGHLGSTFEESNTTGELRILNIDIGCEVGDVIQIRMFTIFRKDFSDRYYGFKRWLHNKTIFKVSKSSLGKTDLANVTKDFSIKDFIKEILWRTALTPILIKETNTIKFIKLDDRLDFNNSQDLSNNFVKRTSELYKNDYAQKNILRLNNSNNLDTTGNGYINVENVNLNDEKIIIQSKIYAPDKNNITEFDSVKTNRYKIWEGETKDIDGNLEISYKSLTGRFYFIRQSEKTGVYKFVSEKLSDEETSNNILIVNDFNTLFDEAVFNNYSEYQKIFNNFRIQNLELAITNDIFIGLDLTKPIFIRQENAYYICNKISYEEGKNSTGEFIKINKI